MGHLNEKDVYNLQVSPQLVNNPLQACQSCIMESNIGPFLTFLCRIVIKRLQLLHPDVEEISPKAYGGYRHLWRS